MSVVWPLPRAADAVSSSTDDTSQGTNNQALSFGKIRRRAVLANTPTVTIRRSAGSSRPTRAHRSRGVPSIRGEVARSGRASRSAFSWWARLAPSRRCRASRSRYAGGRSSRSRLEFVEMFGGFGASRVLDLLTCKAQRAGMSSYTRSTRSASRRRRLGLLARRARKTDQILVEMDDSTWHERHRWPPRTAPTSRPGRFCSRALRPHVLVHPYINVARPSGLHVRCKPLARTATCFESARSRPASRRRSGKRRERAAILAARATEAIPYRLEGSRPGRASAERRSRVITANGSGLLPTTIPPRARFKMLSTNPCQTPSWPGQGDGRPGLSPQKYRYFPHAQDLKTTSLPRSVAVSPSISHLAGATTRLTIHREAEMARQL